MEGLENGHLVAHFRQIAGAGQACGAGTDHSHLLAVGFLRFSGYKAVLPGPVGHKALQLADGDRLALDSADALALALALLGAHAAADSRKGAGLGDGGGRLGELSLLHLVDELGNVDGNGTTLDTLGILTVDAAGGLSLGLLLIVAKADLLKIGGSHLGILFSNRYFL